MIDADLERDRLLVFPGPERGEGDVVVLVAAQVEALTLQDASAGLDQPSEGRVKTRSLSERLGGWSEESVEDACELLESLVLKDDLKIVCRRDAADLG